MTLKTANILLLIVAAGTACAFPLGPAEALVGLAGIASTLVVLNLRK